MKSAILILAMCGLVSTGYYAQEKSFTEQLEGIKTSGKELTKNASTDNSSVGQSGELNTSIPLVTVSGRSLSFPLQLHYSSGVTVDQQSGPVGLGWALPVGSITRDYGAFEPDYTATSNEVLMQSSKSSGGQNGWIQASEGASVDPSLNGQYLGYNGIQSSTMLNPMSDQYRVSVPGFLSNTFWNSGAAGQAHTWALTDYARWKITAQEKNFAVSQEFSRINELNLGSCTGTDCFNVNGSYAAAIGMLPYVKNSEVHLPSLGSGALFSEQDKVVRYDDFGQFTVTDENGTVYVFGRPLRGQKYVFSDDPYWSTRSTAGNGENKGNFWKIDFIAEWLLTEIRSADYEDLNGNGIADDGDAGDWIRFEYTTPTKNIETVLQGGNQGPAGRMNQDVPTYREWSNFSQTDQASSLMRERAYLQRIVTPVQEIDLTISQRFEVDHDYYTKPANRYGNDYYFVDRQYGTTGSEHDFDIEFPVETMKYDTITVTSRLFDKALYPNENLVTGQVILRYAEKGSAEELAVSNYLILDNDGNEKLIDNEEIGKPGTAMNITDYNDGLNKRGKTTLLGVDYYGANLLESDKTSYAFEYGFNPSYDEIHKRAIVNKYFFPSVRQGITQYSQPEMRAGMDFSYPEILTDCDGTTTIANYTLSPYDFLINFPYKERYYKLATNNTGTIECWSSNPSLTFSEVSYALSPIQDVFGYYYLPGCQQPTPAWTLTGITYPTGGKISFEFEAGQFDLSDAPDWAFDAQEIPFIAQYNQLAKARSYCQDDYNVLAEDMSFYLGWNGKRKTLTATFETVLPETIGFRLKNKTVNDRINPATVTSYVYGTGHMTSLPAQYLTNVIGGFNSFLMRERHRHDWEKQYYPLQMTMPGINLRTDYDWKMQQAAISNITLDNYATTHFYETLDVVASDGSKTRTWYGAIGTQDLNTLFPDFGVFCTRLEAGFWNGRYVIGGNLNSASPLVIKKTESYQSGQSLPYQTVSYTYQRFEKLNRSIPFYYGGTSLQVFDNVFEVYLPISCIFGSGTCVKPSDILLDAGLSTVPIQQDPNATWSTNLGNRYPAFVQLDGSTVSSSFYLPGNYTLMAYEKWGTYALRMTKEESNYKGMISSVERTFDNTHFYLKQEKNESVYAAEDYITTYEYANEFYTGQTTAFTDHNLLNLPCRKTTYLNAVAAANALSAEVITYDFTSFSVPRMLDVYAYETATVDHSTGAFTLPAFSTTGTGWRKQESARYLYNRAGVPVMSRGNRIYNKTVTGNGLNTAKAVISSPNGQFDATYTGFEDLYGKRHLSDWTTDSYLDEQWFTSETETGSVAAVINATENAAICDVNSSYNQGMLYHVISVDDVSHLEVGEEVVLTYTASGTTTQVTRTIAAITPKADYSTYVNSQTLDYILCFTTAALPNQNIVATNVTISYTEPLYRLSRSYSRTGEYSYKLPTLKADNDTPKRTPVRPVKVASTALGCTSNPPQSNCYQHYQASVWLKYDKDIPLSTPTQETPPVQSGDPAGDAIYRRGTVSTTTSQNVKIVCETWNSTHTQLLESYTYYPQDMNTAWQQFIIDVPVLIGTAKTVDVYVVNELEQIGVPVLQNKSVFVDDILVYPAGAKYSYQVFDKFGNTTFAVNNDDVFTQSLYDQKGRPVAARNAYGRTATEISYFDQVTDWNAQNNHVTERKWVANGLYSESRYYLDGFGKTKQAMLSDNVRNTRAVSETNVYNTRGQVYRAYKPYYLSGHQLGAKYDAAFANRVQALYGSDYAYSEVVYEATPDSKLSAMYPPRTNTESAIVSTQSDYVTTTALTHPYLSTTFAAGTLIVHELIDALGAKTKTYIDNLGRVILEEHEIGYVNGSGQTHTQATDGAIAVVSSGTLQTARTWFVYDGAGRMTETYDPDGKKTEYFYNSLGLMVKSISPDQGQSEMRYDKYGQVRFVKNARDYEAIQSNNYGCDQFKYTKYDVWGHIVESGVLTVAPNSLGGSTINPPFPTTEFFDDYATINNQNWPVTSSGDPTAVQPFVQVHEITLYGDDRENYNSTLPINQTTYSDHTLNTSTYRYSAGKTDMVSMKYCADGQPSTTIYQYDGLSGGHAITPVYNDMHLATGKDYSNSANSGHNFQWRTTIDNLGRPTLTSNVYNGITTQTGKYYYDPLGNLLMTGVGTTGNSANPHIDYQVIKKDIRDQFTSQMSKFFRVGLTYDVAGNITNQYWSNAQFDAAGSSSPINQYQYTYDRMGRLLGADYKQSTLTYNPFAYFNSTAGNFPSDFTCGVNESQVMEYLAPLFSELESNITIGIHPKISNASIGAINELQAFYISNNQAWATMDGGQKSRFLGGYLDACANVALDPGAFELYRALEENDTDHQDDLNNNPLAPELMKYTTELLAGMPFISQQDCYPNPGATAYSYLPSFTMPMATTNVARYDEAQWYATNGNIKELHRNDDNSVRTVQNYTYGSSLNNKLTSVSWTIGTGTPFAHSYTYDASGNLLTDPRNNVTAIGYSLFDNLPATITDNGSTHQYRYFGGQRSVKLLGDNDREYYIDGIVLKENGNVKSYQTATGYATPTVPNSTAEYFYHVKDWLGSVRVTIDAAGTVLNGSDYYPYGKKLPGRNAFNSSYEGYRYQFTGHEFDGETGYQYHGARYYSEELGRYMSVDPILKYHESPFAYAANNPIICIDPTGMDSVNLNGKWYWQIVHGDHYGSIAEKTGLTVQNLNDWNSQDPLNLESGTLLNLQDNGKVHFVYELKTPNIYRLTVFGLTINPSWRILNYESDKAEQKQNRSEVCPSGSCNGIPGTSCDEFPYASSMQGGLGAVSECVPRKENSSQGGSLSNLYRTMERGDPYLVIPVPAETGKQPVRQPVFSPEEKKVPSPYRELPVMYPVPVITPQTHRSPRAIAPAAPTPGTLPTILPPVVPNLWRIIMGYGPENPGAS